MKEIFVILNNFSKTLKNRKMKEIFKNSEKSENYFHFKKDRTKVEFFPYSAEKNKIFKNIENNIDKMKTIC